MAKNSATVSESQLAENPKVSIVYSPEKELLALGNRALEVLVRLRGVKVNSPRSLEVASEVIQDGQDALDQISAIRGALAQRVADAFEPYKKFPIFHDASINITLTIPVRQQIETAHRTAKSARATYLAAEDARIKREQMEKQAEQDRINREAAAKAAAEAKKLGADKQTVAAIKEEVLATPAPVVTSKAAEVAQSAGASVRYQYTAKITSLKSFLGFCLNNPVMLATLTAAIPDIEKAFRKMASDQKESFKFPGVEYVKTPVDVNRRGA